MRGTCKDLGFMHPSEEHHSGPEHAGGKLLHSGMQKTVIHKITLPEVVINHYVTPLGSQTCPSSAQQEPRLSPSNSPSQVRRPSKTTQE